MDLFILDLELFLIWDLEPFTSSIDLPVIGDRSFIGRWFNHSYDLRFYETFFHSDDPQIDDALW